MICCFTAIAYLESIKQNVLYLLVGIGALTVAFITGFTTLKSGHFARRQVSTAALLPYIPPIAPNTLPVEEVLVRGSQEPTQEQRTVLLRAAGEKDDKPEQLLRASVGEKEAGT